MTDNDKKQIRRWIWFFLIHGGFIWFLYDWTHNRNEGALNLLMIVSGLLYAAKCKLIREAK